MAQAGVLAEDDRVELVDGEVTEMTPIGPAHAACVMRLTTALVPRAGARAVISVQNPLELGARLEFYPDIVLLHPPAERYLNRLPQPGDVLLVVEVADTSLESDREVKIPRYAQAGIKEVWLVDLRENLAVNVESIYS